MAYIRYESWENRAILKVGQGRTTLVIALHGFSQRAETFLVESGIINIPDMHRGVMILAPQARGTLPNWRNTYRNRRKDTRWIASAVYDMINRDEIGIETTIVVVGFSDGALHAHWLARDLGLCARVWAHAGQYPPWGPKQKLKRTGLLLTYGVLDKTYARPRHLINRAISVYEWWYVWEIDNVRHEFTPDVLNVGIRWLLYGIPSMIPSSRAVDPAFL